MSESAPEPAGQAQAHSVGYRIVRAAFVVLFFWVFWKFGGYVITALVVRRFGSGVASDAYFFATQAVVYGLIFAPALSVVLPAFMPVFIEERARRGERAATEFAGTVLTLVLIGCVLLLAGGWFYAGPATETLVRGFDPQVRAVGVALLRWLLPGAALMLVFLVLRAVLNSCKVFSYPSAAEAVQKFVWVAVFVATASVLGVWSVAVGFVVGSAVMVVLAAWGLRGRSGALRPRLSALGTGRFAAEAAVALAIAACTAAAVYACARGLPAGLSRYRDLVLMTVVLLGVVVYAAQLHLRSRGRTGAMARFALLAVPLAISTFFASYRNVVTFYFQSFTARGVFSDIEAARKVANFPTELVALALSVAMLPYLCELASRRDHAVLGDIVTKSLRMLAVGFVPLTVVALVLADPLCRLAFDRGDRALDHLHFTARAFQLIAFPLVVYAAERVLMQAYFSLQRMWAPALLGMAATAFQVAFLAVPIYALGYDYPMQIFLLTALAFPVSRVLKNAALLLVLKRHLPVLPARSTLVFAAKLTLLSALAGAAAYAVLPAVERAVPYAGLRQRKVVVDSFDAQEETWSSLNAESVEVRPAPGGPPHGEAVAMAYRRHGRVRPELVRRLEGVRTDRAASVAFAVCSAEAVEGLSVSFEGAGGARTSAVLEGGLPAGQWREFTVPLPVPPLAAATWAEAGPPRSGANTLFVDALRFLDAGGGVVFEEDFERNGWQCPAGLQPAVAADGAEGDGHALKVPAGAAGVRKDLSGYDLAGTELLRCRLLSPSRRPATVELAVRGPGGEAVQVVNLPGGRWQTVQLSRQAAGTSRADWAGLSAVELRLTDAPEGVLVDDVSFRCPPRVVRYTFVTFLHCAAPSLAALAVILVGLKLLRFEELDYVVRWVRERGWRRRQRSEEAGADVGA